MLKQFMRVFLMAAFIVAASQNSTFAGITEPLEIVNETGKPIMSLYFVPVQKKDWGNDLVGSGVMNQGERRSINYDTSYIRYKLKVEFADGTTIIRKGVDFVDLLDAWRISINQDGTCSKNARG